MSSIKNIYIDCHTCENTKSIWEIIFIVGELTLNVMWCDKAQLSVPTSNHTQTWQRLLEEKSSWHYPVVGRMKYPGFPTCQRRSSMMNISSRRGRSSSPMPRRTGPPGAGPSLTWWTGWGTTRCGWGGRPIRRTTGWARLTPSGGTLSGNTARTFWRGTPGRGRAT